MPSTTSPEALREALISAHVYLIFTPELCAPRDPLEVLREALPWVDMIQVRPKPRESGLDPLAAGAAPLLVSEARNSWEWCRRVLELVRGQDRVVPVIVNDRVDVAAALAAEGLAGVHLGQGDFPAALARGQLGEGAMIGLSTHSASQVVRAQSEPVDYLGFGPFRATATKGYARGLGGEACWIAQEASDRPVFPIGGIDLTNVDELERIPRAAIGSAILSAPDPARAARAIRAALANE
ncbi:MAG TPA: thiamine phosphate synthase [Planctomycetota bacterium]|nr:thiamine phosphate synthase [Planctomycetota bacterium]